MRAAAAARVVVAALAALCVAEPAAAQSQVLGLNVEGDVEAGFRGFAEQPTSQHRAKFEEYRDFPAERPFLYQLNLRLFRPDESYSTEFSGSKWGQQDQEFSLRTGRLGLWEFGFEWDQTPHIFSTNARMLATQTSRGVFTLPAGLAGRAAGAGLPADGPIYNAAPRLDEISVRWDTARILFKLTPTPDLEIKTEYTRINKDGDRPMGVAMGFTFMEVLEPIEQTVHDFRLQGTLAREQWQLQFGYTFSLFHNALSSIRADNPVRDTDSALAFSASTGKFSSTAQAGQVSLPPDNMAHTFSLAGGANLPWWRTRLTSNFSYSFRLQNDDFMPHTRNPVLLAATDAQGGGSKLVLPQRSLNGNVQIFLFNLNATSRPLPPLTLSLKYRLYDYVDLKDLITFPGRVESDQTLENESIRPARFSFTKHNADIDGRWQVVRPVAFTLGAGWERWDRGEAREVPESDEFFAKAALDATPSDWLLIKLKYTPSFRRINRYNSRAPRLVTITEELAVESLQQTPLFRKDDEADRDRQRVDLLVQFTPTDTFSVTPTVGYRFDEYPGIRNTFGVQREVSWSAGTDLSWTPMERVSFSAGYMHESNFQKMRNRSRPASTGLGVAFDFADFDWIADHTDTIETAHVGMKATLIPKVLDWTLGANYSYALGRIETYNPVAPVDHAGFPITISPLTARAFPFPAFTNSLLRIETDLRYYFWKNWTARLGYALEEFKKHDWRTDTLNPFNPGVNDIFLGNDLKNYTAHILTLTLGYRFK